MESQDIFLEPALDKHIFLKKNNHLSVDELKNITKSYRDSDLNKSDRDIVKKINEEINISNKFPSWWTEQESLYLKKIDNLHKSLKYIAFRYKFKRFPVDKVVTDFPLYVLIEPVSVCNLRCPFCFQMDKEFTRKPYAGVMEMDLFKRVVDECEQNGAQAVTLASRGEPTLHPKLPEMLEYLKGKFFEIKLNTNGTRLTDSLCHDIFKNEVNDVVLSIDSDKKELFEMLRKNAIFEEVLENVRNLKRIRDEYYPDSITAIRISGVKFTPEQDNESFMKFWNDLADEITISASEERWDTYNNKTKPQLTEPCALLWERFYVWYDGTCNPCDVDYMSKLSPGILTETESIKSIWNSESYKSLRSTHLKKLRSKYNPCDRCGVY
jgi:pyruvate-formate lyase-activating enzyme